MPSKADIPRMQGENIMRYIRARKHNPGGKNVEITGTPGSGKTSLLHHFAGDIIKNNPNERVFWREGLGNPLQFINNPNKWKIFVEKRANFRIVDRNNDGGEQHFHYNYFDQIPVISYDMERLEQDRELRMSNADLIIQQDEIFKGLFKTAIPGQLNVIYFENPFNWVDLYRYCRTTPGWQTFLVDEYEDLFPTYNTGELWKRVEWTKNNLKHGRKGLVNGIWNTQKKTDVDWRIRSKMDVWGYCYGAIVDGDSPLKKEAIARLKVGELWWDRGRSIFGKVAFKPYHAKEDVFLVGVMS